MSTDAYDRAAVELVTGLLPGWGDEPEDPQLLAERVLDHLADAGLLLQPGGETTEQIEVQTAGLKYPCGDMAAAWRQHGELRGKDWVKDAWIVTRTVHYGPWRPVPPWTEVPQ